ncbi:MAG: transposase [Bacteroidota bacterium]|nr:transposase [Bacteroidota bacterium]
MKAIRSNRNVSPHGGIVPILKKIKEFGIPQVIRGCLGKRVAQSTYSYEDILIAWVLTSLCGGTRLDHITKMKKKLSIIPGLKLPSHDTLGRGMKKLATEVVMKESVKGRGSNLGIHVNHYNDNGKMNNLLIKASKRIGALQEGRLYTLHIDATFIETNCVTSNCNNEGKKYGFYPMICLIDNMPVYISMRNGDSNAEFQIKECLEQCLNLLAENKIRVHNVISDSAGYNKSLIDMLHSRGVKFNIHMPFNTMFKTMLNQIDNCDNWKKVELKTAYNIRECEIGEIKYKMHESQNVNRIIVARIPNKNTIKSFESIEEKERRKMIEIKMKGLSDRKLLKGEGRAYKLGKWKPYKKYNLKLIITNDWKKTPEELIVEYNKRGDAERQFDAMKNDFGWRFPPFMNMNENTVFMIAAALANNVLRGILNVFKKKLPELRLNTRLRDFQFIFIDVACEYINNTFIFYNTDMAYEKIM